MKIALHGKTFLTWGGGIDLLGYFIRSMSTDLDGNKNELYLILPQKRFLKKIEAKLKSLRDIFKVSSPQKSKKENVSFTTGLNFLIDIDKNLKLITYEEDNLTVLSKKLLKNKIEVVIPTADDLGEDFILPWAGYIFDLQHKYFPEFFSEKEVRQRDQSISKLIHNANTVLVNSKFVKNDLKNFFKAEDSKIISLPFSPFLRKDWRERLETIEVAESLPENFFLISNQFWFHKSHITAFEALRIFIDKYHHNDVHIVCTGNTYDYRQPNYFNTLMKKISELRLTDRIHFLGYISKEKQLKIMSKAISVIQPSLFEGGPGGGAVYDAVALGVRSIVSDIPVNLEIDDELVTFFKTGDAEDLADKMHDNFKIKPKQIATETLKLKEQKRFSLFQKTVFDAIKLALKRKN